LCGFFFFFRAHSLMFFNFLRGFLATGDILVSSLSNIFNTRRSMRSCRQLVGHSDKILCLSSPEDFHKDYLLSGSADYTIKMWNLKCVGC
jgi:WD40 repeat protein